MDPSDLTLLGMFERLRIGWQKLTALVIVGGLVGMVLALVLPVDQLATASLGIGIDYGRTQVLDANSERQALLQAQYLLLSDSVLEATLDQAGAEAGVDTVAEFRRLIRLDRYEGRWNLQVRSRQAQSATQLVDAWALASIEALDQATEAAMQAQAWQAAMFPVGCELVSIGGSGLRYWRCVQPETKPEAAAIPAELLPQVKASYGIIPGLTYAYLQAGTTGARPQSMALVWLVVAGCLIGLVAALLAAAFARWPFADDGRVSDLAPANDHGAT